MHTHYTRDYEPLLPSWQDVASYSSAQEWLNIQQQTYYTV